VKRLGAGVHGMTGSAGSPAALLVYVQEVEVDVAVAKARNSPTLLDRHQLLFVTRKAQPVIRLAELRIEAGWEWFLEQAEVGTSMRTMTTGTVVLEHWLVPLLVVAESRGHVDQHVFARFDRPIVTIQAQIPLRLLQDRSVIRRMGGMAGETFIAGGDGIVTDDRLLTGFHDVFVALLAQLSLLGKEHLRVGPTVWIVTVGAVVLGRIVDVLGAIDQLEDFFVASAAQIQPLCQQKAGAVRCVGVVAHVAGAERRRTMFVFLLHDLLFVTVETEPSKIFVLHFQQERLYLSAVGVVAVEAIFFGRFVDPSRVLHLESEHVVASEAVLGRVFRLEIVEICVLFVALLTLSRLGNLRPVEVRLVRDRDMAAAAHTRPGWPGPVREDR